MLDRVRDEIRRRVVRCPACGKHIRLRQKRVTVHGREYHATCGAFTGRR